MCRQAAVYQRWATSGRMASARAYALLEDDIFKSGFAEEAEELLAQPQPRAAAGF